MKKLIFTLTLACALALNGQPAMAQAKKKNAAADEAAAAAEKAKAAAEKPKAGAQTAKTAAETPPAAAESAKPKRETIPMYARADEIDAKAKTITQVAKDGGKSVNTVTATTEIKNSDKEAKFGDIKVGDWVSGSRKKTGEHAYEVLKITKFGPKAEKTEKTEKSASTEKPAGEPKKK